MVNQEILEGLRNALARGYSLESAMMSFFNAGYKKEEIEEAAGFLHQHPSHPLSHPEKPSSPEALESEQIKKTEKTVSKIPYKPLKQPLKPVPSAPSAQAQKPVQQVIKKRISEYEPEPSKKIKLKIIILIILLVMLAGAFIGVIIFKEQVINFFNNLLV